MKYAKVCRDCNSPFTTETETRTKCEHCLDRDQSYRERGIREEMGYDRD